MNRVNAYIDGFNLYNGLRSSSGKRYLWLDLERLVTRLLKPGQELQHVRYLTASVRNDPPALQRQSQYLGALANQSSRLEIIMGRLQEKSVACRGCRSRWRTYEEKETDVSIAVALVEDTAGGRVDTALVLSTDSDLCPAVRAAKRLHPEIRVIAVFPPNRRSDELRPTVDGYLSLGARHVRASLLPESVSSLATGVAYSRPGSWR